LALEAVVVLFEAMTVVASSADKKIYGGFGINNS
jgi:hypothetical protein